MFQIAWLVCVLGGSIPALLITALVLAIHLSQTSARRREAIFLLQCAAIGFLCDIIFFQSGILSTGAVQENAAVNGITLPPLWLSCLWILFGTTAGHALRIFHDRPWWSAATGGLIAPLSYLAGARLSGLQIMEPVWLGLSIIAISWSIVFPLLMYFYTVNRLHLPK